MRITTALSAIVALLVCSIAPTAHATKTAPPLPIQLTASVATTTQGGVIEYLMHLANKSSSSYWGVTVGVTFPDTVTCTGIISANRKGCSLTGNRLTCYWNDYYDWWTTDVKVSCTVKPTAPCDGVLNAVADLTVNKPAQTNSSTAAVRVVCANPTPTPTIPATATPLATSTPIPVPTITATPIPTYTSTPIATFTATSVPTSTPTQVATPTATGTSVPVVTATPTATFTPTGTPSTNVCESYSILRRVQGNYDRNLVTIREQVRVLPDGDKLSCLQNILRETSAPCLTYGQVELSDTRLQSELRSESAAGTCFGMAQLTYSLLNQACTLDDRSDECEQFLALNLLRSNALPAPHTPAGICLGREHNPRYQEILVDKDCRIIFDPTWEERKKSCPAANISVSVYSYSRWGYGKDDDYGHGGKRGKGKKSRW